MYYELIIYFYADAVNIKNFNGCGFERRKQIDCLFNWLLLVLCRDKMKQCRKMKHPLWRGMKLLGEFVS